MKKSYQERLFLPLEGMDDVNFFTPNNTPVAKGYTRVVIGGRGPYIEFSPKQIIQESFEIPPNQEFRKTSSCVYYVEARTIDAAYVKLYIQRKVVDYADYRVGILYISPFELISDKYPILIER